MKEKIVKYFRHPTRFIARILLQYPSIWNDITCIRLLFYLNLGKLPNLKAPSTFSEKMQWLKLYDRKPKYVLMVDKYEAKKYVSDIIGEQYVIPTISIYDKVEEIDFDKLPNQFVLKCTHDSGGIVICKDKNRLDKECAISKLKRGLNRNFYWYSREWPYKNVKPRIIAEKFMENKGGESSSLLDYKFFCFNGEPEYCQVISDRNTKMSIDFFDKNWIHQPFHEPREYPFSTRELKRPSKYDEMLVLARKLSYGHPFLRVDFYEIDGQVYFGELTFFPTSGIGGFDPVEWDLVFGEKIDITC